MTTIRNMDWDLMPVPVLPHTFMAHGLVPSLRIPGAATVIVPPASSISLEWQFCLVAPLSVPLTRRRTVILAALFPLIVVFAQGNSIKAPDHEVARPHASFLPLSLKYFVLGIASYHLIGGLTRVSAPRVLLVVIVVFAATGSYPFAVWVLVMGAFSCLDIGRILSGRRLVWRGKTSSSTYLVRIPVKHVIERKVLWPILDDRGAVFLALLMVLSVPIVLSLSVFCSDGWKPPVSHWVVDWPMHFP